MSVFLLITMRQLSHLRVDQKGKYCFLSPTRSADKNCIQGDAQSGSRVMDYQFRILTLTGPAPSPKKHRTG